MLKIRISCGYTEHSCALHFVFWQKKIESNRETLRRFVWSESEAAFMVSWNKRLFLAGHSPKRCIITVIQRFRRLTSGGCHRLKRSFGRPRYGQDILMEENIWIGAATTVYSTTLNSFLGRRNVFSFSNWLWWELNQMLWRKLALQGGVGGWGIT